MNDAEFERQLLSHRAHLLAYARGLTKAQDTAEDLQQSTLMRAWLRRESFQLGTNMKGWLLTICLNEYRSQYRRPVNHMVSDEEGFFTNSLVAADDPHIVLECQQVVNQLRFLPGQMKQAVIAIAVNGGQYDEAAQDLDVAVGTMKSRLNRARALLESGMFQGITEDEFNERDKSAAIEEENDLRKWHYRVKALFVEDNLDISEIASKLKLSRTDVHDIVTTLRLKRKRVQVQESVN